MRPQSQAPLVQVVRLGMPQVTRFISPHAAGLWWRRASLRTKMYLSYLILISVPLIVVALAAYGTATTTIERNAQDFSAQLTGDIRANLDSYEQQAARLTYYPFLGANVQRILHSYQTGSPATPSYQDVADMRAELSYLGHAHLDLAGIYVATSNGTLFSWTASGDLKPHPFTTAADWYQAALRADPNTVYLPTRGQEMILVATGKVVSLVRALHDARGARLGVVRVDLEAAALASVAQRVSLGAQGRLIIATGQGDVVYPIDPDATTRLLAREIAARQGAVAGPGRLRLDVAGQSLLATSDRSAASGWVVAGVVPAARLLTGANYLRAFILSVAVLCILAGALCATLVLGRLTRPLRQLRGAMRRVEARDLTTRIAVQSEDEVGQLAHSFNTMLDELRRLVDDVLRAQLHEREAELHALQNQINPHFLYNTLESINMMALTHGDRDISRMVTSLGRLLRLTLSSAEALIPLDAELEHVRHYLVVQRMRYGDRISITVDVDPALLDCIVPKLTLQPLVENALYHGLEPRPGAGCVVVRGCRAGDDLTLTIEDDGAGMDAARLATVRAQLEEEAPRDRRSIGIANVHKRLKLYYGPAYGVSIASALGEGTRVTLTLPRTPRAEAAEETAASAPFVTDVVDRVSEERNDDVSLANRR
jgi:two-component system sensor histidine kinase YesM